MAFLCTAPVHSNILKFWRDRSRLGSAPPRFPVLATRLSGSLPEIPLRPMTKPLTWCCRTAVLVWPDRCSGVALPSSANQAFCSDRGSTKWNYTNCYGALIKTLRREKHEQYHRHVSVGDLLTDRCETAGDYGFGDGTSCYDNVLILVT